MLGSGPDRPPRQPLPRWLFVLGAVVLVAGVVAVGAVRVARHHRASRRAASAEASPTQTPAAQAALQCDATGAPGPPVAVAPNAVRALTITGVGAGVPGLATSLERRDRSAVDGPWTVVVRRAGGSLGRQGAVVTFPVGHPASGRTVQVGGVAGTAAVGLVTWPLAGAYARIRGDVAEAELVAIATYTRVIAGRPAVPAAPTGYVVVAAEPYRSPSIDEIRYGPDELGAPGAVLGGLIFTGVARGGGIEDQLYATTATSAGAVRGHPAVESAVFGGNGSVAWEPAPGVIAYIAYSGTESSPETTKALRCLAQRTHIVSDAQWRALHPQTIDEANQP